MFKEVPEDLLLHGLKDVAVEETLRVECGIAAHVESRSLVIK